MTALSESLVLMHGLIFFGGRTVTCTVLYQLVYTEAQSLFVCLSGFFPPPFFFFLMQSCHKCFIGGNPLRELTFSNFPSSSFDHGGVKLAYFPTVTADRIRTVNYTYSMTTIGYTEALSPTALTSHSEIRRPEKNQ